MRRRASEPRNGRMTPCRPPPCPSTARPRGSSTTSSCWSRGAGADPVLQRARQPGHADPAARAGATPRPVELVDPEGLPLALVSTARAARELGVKPLTHAQFGPFRRLYLTPGAGPRAVRRPHLRPGRRRRSPTPQLDAARATPGPRRAARPGRHRHPRALPGRPDPGHAGRRRPRSTPRWSRSRSRRTATPRPTTRSASRWSATTPDRTRSWRSPSRTRSSRRDEPIPTRSPRSSTSSRPPATEQGLVLFFTGLSGSGKSTLARALMDRILEQRRAHGHQPRRRRRTPEPVGRPDLLQGGPGDQHPPDRLGGRRDRPARRGRGVQPDRAVRRDPAAGAGDGRRGRRRVLPGPRRDPARGVRAPRPQGPLRQGPARRDPGVHRHLLAVRGAARTPPSGSTPPAGPSRTPSTTSSSPSARGISTGRSP